MFGDQAVAAVPIERIVHYADVITLEGASCRLRERGIDSLPSIRTTEQTQATLHSTVHFSPGESGQDWALADT